MTCVCAAFGKKQGGRGLIEPFICERPKGRNLLTVYLRKGLKSKHSLAVNAVRGFEGVGAQAPPSVKKEEKKNLARKKEGR